MTGMLYKQYNVWMVEYEDTSFRKKVKKQIPLHPEDVDTIVDDNEYANNFDLKPVNFDIVLISDEFNKAKLVAKLIEAELPKINITKENEDERL